MRKRPVSITVIGWMFLVVGFVGFLYHLGDFKVRQPFDYGLFAICFVRLLAVLGGIFLLRGFSWARWLLVGWLAFHVVLSAFHTALEFVIHGLLLAVIAYFLFRARATAYFRGGNEEPGQAPPIDDKPAA